MKITLEDLKAFIKVSQSMRSQLNAHDQLITDETFDITQLFSIFIFEEVKEYNQIEPFLTAVETICEWQEVSDHCYEFLDKLINTDQIQVEVESAKPCKPKLTVVK